MGLGPQRRRGGHFIVDPAFDFGWFVLPGLLSAVVAASIHALFPSVTGSDDRGMGPEGSLAIWIVGVLLVDVAHVYASLYRTYLDPEARVHHRRRLWVFPLLALGVGFALHVWSPAMFWRVLAYIAIFHFIKQHEGFAALYLRGGGESAADVRLGKLAVWAGTLAPVIWWHANLPRRFAWFMEGDLVGGLPAAVGTAALGMQAMLIAAFVVRRLILAANGRPNWMVPALVLTPALCWNLGIVWTNDDRVFTVTNVFLHGVPYLALVWVAGGRQRWAEWIGDDRRGVGPSAVVTGIAALYYGALVVLAVSEEALWDRLVWHEHGALFGAGQFELGGVPLALVVALLTVPQATHYCLDRFIWRAGPENPRLAEALGFPPREG